MRAVKLWLALVPLLVGAGKAVTSYRDQSCNALCTSVCAQDVCQALVEDVAQQATQLNTSEQLTDFFNNITYERTYSFDTAFYPFIFNFDGICLAHGAHPDFVGTTLGASTSLLLDLYGANASLLLESFIIHASGSASSHWMSYDALLNNDTIIKVAYLLSVDPNIPGYESHIFVGSGYIERPCTTTTTTSTTTITTLLNSTTEDPAEVSLRIGVITGSVTVLVIIVTVGVVMVKRYQKKSSVGRFPKASVYIKAVEHTPQLEDIEKLLEGDAAAQWQSVESLAKLLTRYRNSEQTDDDPEVAGDVIKRAEQVLQQVLSESQHLLETAVKSEQYDDVPFYTERVKMLQRAVAERGRAKSFDTNYECVVPGLLLRRDRFNGDSTAFLGRGAFSAVSKGYLMEVMGTTQVRTTVAVKEIQKTGMASEGRAMHELLLLKKKLRQLHPNIIQIHNVMSTSNCFYVVMQCCSFSLQTIPDEFTSFIHGESGDGSAGAIVLAALVQDMLRAVGLLHSKHIMHCDIKPGNLLVTFNRAGKRHEYDPQFFHLAQLVVADFGGSRAFKAASADDGAPTVLVSGSEGQGDIEGTEPFMCREMLTILNDQRQGNGASGSPIREDILIENDTFGCGCSIAFLCSNGTHPFESPLGSLPENILSGRRVPLRELNIKNPSIQELVDRFTTSDRSQLWTVQTALGRSALFNKSSEILLQEIHLNKKPSCSCRDVLLSPELTERYSFLRVLVEGSEQVHISIDHTVRELLAKANYLPTKLDPDFLYAITAYTFDNGVIIEENIYYTLNYALRHRQQDPGAFNAWQGYLYYLLHGIRQLKKFEGVVFRGGNEGLDQDTVRREYTLGRLIQWAGFSSTSQIEAASKEFIRKDSGVLFRITVFSGADIGPYSHIPTENEVLLSPNTRFTVTRALYTDEDGYACVDLAEVQDSKPWSS